MQDTGRLHRLNPGRAEVRIFDDVDSEVPVVEGMFQKRLRAYRAIGYLRGEPWAGGEERAAGTVVEHGRKALPHLDTVL